MPLAWINNQFVDEADASVNLRDTGLLHAAGLFTTMRAYGGRVFQLDRHLARLRNSCEVLFIPLQYKNDALSDAITQLLRQNDLADARLRLTVTRGFAHTDPLHGLSLHPTVFITASALEPYPMEYYQRGMTVIVLDQQKLNPYDIQAGHKTLNYFSRLSSLREANQRGAGESLWFNVHNYLQSGSISNIFLVKNNILFTPPTRDELLDQALAESMPYPRSNVLPGVTRGVIFDIAQREGIELRPAALTINDLLAADEVFLTNSIMGVMPVCRIERKAIGNDRPGPLTIRLSQEYEHEIQAQ